MISYYNLTTAMFKENIRLCNNSTVTTFKDEVGTTEVKLKSMPTGRKCDNTKIS